MLGALQAALFGAASAPITYDSLVWGFGPDVISYWKFAGTGADAKGIADALITGSPELNVDTIVDFDTIAEGALVDGKCIAWTGIVENYAEVPHNVAHKTAAGTIVVTAQHDTLNAKATLLAADANAAAGGISIEVNTDGSQRCFLRNAAGTAIILTGPAGDIQLNQAYTHVFKWGAGGGLSHAIWNAAGGLVRRLTDVMTDGVTGTSPIRFGAWHTGVSRHDGPYGRVVWLSRRITDLEEASLARARTIVRSTFSGPFSWSSAKSGDLWMDDLGNTVETHAG